MTSSAPFVLFAPASGYGVGGGHVMRCLTLAQALADGGARCAFLLAAEGEALLARFSDRAFEIVSLEPGLVSSAVERMQPDVLVIDDYSTTFDLEATLKNSARRLVVLDDLADRNHPANLLLDPGYGRLDADYDGLLPDDARRLIGPDFALLRAPFAARRTEALTRPITKRPERLCLSFGLSDVDGIAARAVKLARATLPEVQIDLALAAAAESLRAVRRMAQTDERIHLHVNATDMADLMAAADIGVGAGGASTWERACLGLPTLAVIVADNQRAMIQRMAAEGLLIGVDLTQDDFEIAFTTALLRLSDPALRRTLKDRSAALSDGRGAVRVAEAILAL